MPRSLILLALLVTPLPALAQYRPYTPYQQPRPYQSQPAYVPPFQQRYPEPARSGQSVIYQNGRPKLCHTYANTTMCP
jgi:hypothetical protein